MNRRKRCQTVYVDWNSKQNNSRSKNKHGKLIFEAESEQFKRELEADVMILKNIIVKLTGTFSILANGSYGKRVEYKG